MKKITMHWLNFFIIFIVIFLLGVLIGFLVIPHPVSQKAKSGQVSSVPQEWAATMVAAETTAAPVKASGEIKPPRLIKRVEPIYPEVARQAQVEGTVILEATTDVYGRVKKTDILRSVPLLDQAAIDAVLQWKYEPKQIDGEPKGVIFTVTVEFKLK